MTSAAPITGPLPKGYELLWERMHELSPGDPGGSRFTATLTRDLHGPVDTAVLGNALREVTRRHDMLRMRFADLTADPAVSIDTEVDAPLTVVDLRAYPEPQRRAELEYHLYGESVRRFDLTSPPLWRACLIRLTGDHSVLCLSFPDLLFDAWSDRLLVQDLLRCYAAGLGLAAAPQVMPAGYRELVALHERQYGRTPAQVVAQAGRLRRLPPMLPVEPRRASAGDLLLDPAAVEFEFSAETIAGLDNCALRLRTTTYVVLMTAYAILVAADTHSSRAVLSTVTLGRQSRAEREIVGQFGQDVFVPVEIDWREPVETLIARVHRELVTARLARTGYRNLVRLIGADRYPRPWSDLHLYDSYFQSVVPGNDPPAQGPLRVSQTPGIVARPRPEEGAYPKVGEIQPSALPAWQKQAAPWIVVGGQRQGGALNYNRSFYDDTRMTARAEAFQDLVRTVAADATRPAGRAVG